MATAHATKSHRTHHWGQATWIINPSTMEPCHQSQNPTWTVGCQNVLHWDSIFNPTLVHDQVQTARSIRVKDWSAGLASQCLLLYLATRSVISKKPLTIAWNKPYLCFSQHEFPIIPISPAVSTFKTPPDLESLNSPHLDHYIGPIKVERWRRKRNRCNLDTVLGRISRV